MHQKTPLSDYITGPRWCFKGMSNPGLRVCCHQRKCLNFIESNQPSCKTPFTLQRSNRRQRYKTLCWTLTCYCTSTITVTNCSLDKKTSETSGSRKKDEGRGEICPCRHCRQQCKIFASSVNIFRNNAIYNINESTKYLISSLKLLTYCKLAHL